LLFAKVLGRNSEDYYYMAFNIMCSNKPT